MKNRFLLYIGVALLAFGVFNLSTSHFVIAQEEVPKEESTDRQSDLADIIIQRLLTEIGPIVGAIVAIGIQFARNQGLKISAEAEEYFVNMTKSFVENQSRMLYKEIRDNPQYWEEYLKKGRIPPELGQKAKQNVSNQLKVELKSDEFTKVAREMLTENLDTLVDRYVTENKKETSVRIRILLNEFVPIGVGAVLLNMIHRKMRKRIEKIINDAMDSIDKVFKAEELLFSHDGAKLMVESELNNRIGNIK